MHASMVKRDHTWTRNNQSKELKNQHTPNAFQFTEYYGFKNTELPIGALLFRRRGWPGEAVGAAEAATRER